ILVHRKRLLEVDDVDLVAGTEDVRSHLGVPVARLVAEMDAGLQHLAHGDGHAITPVSRLSLPRAHASFEDLVNCRRGVNFRRLLEHRIARDYSRKRPRGSKVSPIPSCLVEGPRTAAAKRSWPSSSMPHRLRQ